MSESTPPRYHLVVVQDGQPASHESFATRDELVAELKKLPSSKKLADRIRVWVFCGQRLRTTKPPYPYLVEEGRPPTPLFDVPGPGDDDDEGVLAGEDEAAPTAKGYAEATAQALKADHEALAVTGEEGEEPLDDPPGLPAGG